MYVHNNFLDINLFNEECINVLYHKNEQRFKDTAVLAIGRRAKKVFKIEHDIHKS